jgi:hypothetical protein
MIISWLFDNLPLICLTYVYYPKNIDILIITHFFDMIT